MIRLRLHSDARTEGGMADAAQAAPQAPSVPLVNIDTTVQEPLPTLKEDTVESYLAKARKVGGSHRKTAYSLKENVGSIVRASGVQNCVFLTPTLANKDGSPPDPERAQVCWRKLEKSIAAEFPGGGVRILERGGKTSRLHYHVLLNVGADVRTGYDFDASRAAQNRNSRAKWYLHPSANENLVKAEARLYSMASKAGFGRIFHCEPVRSEDEAIKTYLSKYICKHVGQRLLVDKGRRLVAYFGKSVECRDIPSANCFGFGGSLTKVIRDKVCPDYQAGWAWLWRKKTAQYMSRIGIQDSDQAKEKYGPKWCFLHREDILKEVLLTFPYLWLAVMDGMLEADEIEGRDMFEPTRFACHNRERTTTFREQRLIAARAAQACGCTPGEAFVSLFQRGIFREKGHDWKYTSEPVPGEVRTFFKTPDGDVERRPNPEQIPVVKT